jgi:hypothetical protein
MLNVSADPLLFFLVRFNYNTSCTQETMSTQAARKAAKKPQAKAAATNTENDIPTSQASDLSKLLTFVSALTDLANNIDRRLTGGLQGSFLERGSKLEEDKRFFQLPTLFEFREQLPEALKEVNRLIQLMEMDGGKQGKGSGKPNGNMIATIRNMVEQHFETKIRDRDIEIERLKDAVAKLQVKGKARGGKGEQVTGAENADFQSIQTKFDQLEARVTTVELDVVYGESATGRLKAQVDDVVEKQRARDDAEDLLDCNLGDAGRRLDQLEANQMSDRAGIDMGYEEELHELDSRHHEMQVARMEQEERQADSVRKASVCPPGCR